MTAKPIPTKAPGQLVLEDALDGLTNLAQGYLSREQILYKRRLEEREYAFRREQFDTSKDQWQRSFNENMRQFDQQMDFSQQTHEERLAHDVEMQEARIGAQAEISRKQRGVDYTRIKRAREAHLEKLRATYSSNGNHISELNLIGTDPSWQVANGQFPIKEVDWKLALDRVANGMVAPGDQQWFSKEMTPEFAKSFYQQLLDGEDVTSLINRMDRSGLLAQPLQDNVRALGMVESIAIKFNDGGSKEDWLKRSPAERRRLMDEQVANVATLPRLQAKQDARALEMAEAEFNLKADYGGGTVWGPLDNDGVNVYEASNIYIRREINSEGLAVPVLN